MMQLPTINGPQASSISAGETRLRSQIIAKNVAGIQCVCFTIQLAADVAFYIQKEFYS